MRLSSSQVQETASLACALELWNDSSASVEINNTNASKFARATTWALENEMYFSESLDAQNLPVKPVQIAPGGKFMIGPAMLRVTPAVAPRVGAQRLSATTLVQTERITAPPAMISVTPAQWGPTVNGMRLCIGMDATTVRAAEPITVFLYLHNTTNNRVALLTPEWAQPRIQSEDDVFTLTFAALHGAMVSNQSPRAIQRRVLLPGPLFDRPGVYRLRVMLDAPPLSSVPKGVWTGTLISNELTVQVESPEKLTIPPEVPSTAPARNK